MSGRGIAAGTFETEKFEALSALLEEGSVFWDVGAHYGYATLLGAAAMGRGGTVVAFEPSEHNRSYLELHLAWNGVSNVTVLPFAVADRDGEEGFGDRGASSIAQKLGGGDTSVPVRSVSTLLADGLPSPDVVKLDVEGAESRSLEGARDAFMALPLEARPTILCAVHDPEQFEVCTRLLREMGYTVIGAGVLGDFLSGARPWHGDPDLLAVDPSRTALLERMRGTRLFASGPTL